MSAVKKIRIGHNMRLVLGDSYQILMHDPETLGKLIGKVDAVITDYVYGQVFPLEALKPICAGNIITFCASEDHPFDPDEIAYWIKTPSTKNYARRIGRFVEKIYICRQGSTFNKLHWSQMTGVYDDRVIEASGHQWRKPLSLVERLIRIYTNEGDTILDPFMGSGTTLLAARNLKRSFVGIDIDPAWVDYCATL